MYKLYICTAVFMLLSLAKLVLPGHSETLREQVMSIIDSYGAYPAAVEALGRRISQEGIGEEIMRVINMESEELRAVLMEPLSDAVDAFAEK